MSTKETKRPRYHHGNLPAALVDAALALVSERGAEALTLRAVAQRVGVSHAAPYRHFRDKRALVSTIAAQGFDQLAAELEAARDKQPPNPLAAVTHAYLAFALGRPAHYRVMYGVLAEPDEHPDLRRAMSRLVDALRAALAEGRGAHSGGRDRRMAVLYWAQLHGLAALEVAGKLAPADAPGIDTLVAALVEEPLARAAALD